METIKKQKNKAVVFNQDNFNYLNIDKFKFYLLKYFRNHKLISKKFKLDQVFTDVVEFDMLSLFKRMKHIKENAFVFYSDDINSKINYNDSKFNLSLPCFLNAIVFDSLLNEVSKADYRQFTHPSSSHYSNSYDYFMNISNNNKTLASLFSSMEFYPFDRITGKYNKICFWSLYNYFKSQQLNNKLSYYDNNYYGENAISNFASGLIRFLNIQHKDKIKFSNIYRNIILETDKLFEILNWDINKNYLFRCSFSGLFLRKNQSVEIYKDQDIKTFNDIILQFELAYFKNVNSSFNNPCIPSYIINYSDDGIKTFYRNGLGFSFTSYDGTVIFDNDKKTLISKPISRLNTNQIQPRCHTSTEYNKLPIGILPYETEKALLVGIELEVIKKSSCPKNIVKKIENDYCFGNVIVKRDGSVYNGFEIVSVPMSYDYIKKTKFFENLYNNLKDKVSSYKSSDCGFHIHLSRSHFNDLDLVKLCKFFNDRNNKEFLEQVCGRKPNDNSYIQYDGYNYAKTSGVANKLDHIKSGSLFDKYDVVNLKHSASIEFRLFKGNLYFKTAYRYLDFVIALSHFIKTSNFRVITDNNFKKFVQFNKTKYPFIYDFISRLGTDQVNSDTSNKEQVESDLKLIDSFNSRYFKRFRSVNTNAPKVVSNRPLRFTKVRKLYDLRNPTNNIERRINARR